MHRFFVSPAAIHDARVTLDAATTHQMRAVLRLGVGAQIVVLDGSGRQFQVILTRLDHAGAEGRITGHGPASGEPQTRLTLYQALLKGEKFEWVLQKCTEAGVSRFVPLITLRTIPHDHVALAKKESRWRRIIQEAAEQAHRARLPALSSPLDLAAACGEAAAQNDLVIFCWEAASSQRLQAALQAHLPAAARVALFIGPEGGFAPEEALQAQAAGAQVASLGPRILRAETAGLVAIAAILYQAGDM